jgi:putative pyruvate formate lyase activating enzyme
MTEPSYIRLYRTGELARRIEKTLATMESCHLCPRKCRVNRLKGERGFCQTGRKARVASYNAHFGEEAPLVGAYGSGTIFISSCNLLCSFCQNYEISHSREGSDVTSEQIASMMLALSERGCHNINFVTPSHVVPQLLEALPLAIDKGVKVPLVYNSGGYDSVGTLRLLEEVFDVYMPDFKFWDNRWAERYCGASDYREVALDAIREMHRQVGELLTDHRGIAVTGLLVRHLVMPKGIAGSEKFFEFLAKEISPNTYVNVMDQYRPCGSAHKDEFINRRLEVGEYRETIDAARKAGLRRLDARERLRFVIGE